jgi:hypothetical protein
MIHSSFHYQLFAICMLTSKQEFVFPFTQLLPFFVQKYFCTTNDDLHLRIIAGRVVYVDTVLPAIFCAGVYFLPHSMPALPARRWWMLPACTADRGLESGDLCMAVKVLRTASLILDAVSLMLIFLSGKVCFDLIQGWTNTCQRCKPGASTSGGQAKPACYGARSKRQHKILLEEQYQHKLPGRL